MVSNLTSMSNFHSLEVVGRGREAQLEVGDNIIFNVGLYGLSLVVAGNRL